MPRVARLTAPGFPHHVTQRGNNRADVFFDDNDRTTYLSILKHYCVKWDVAVWAYCLMNNHVHILAVPGGEQSLARCIGGTSLVYTQHINSKYQRSGRLWQNRFFSTIVESEAYLWAVARYIEQNPVKAGLVVRAEEFSWSSCRTNINGTDDKLLPCGGWLNEGEREAYAAFLERRDPVTDQKIRADTATGRPMGSDNFIALLEIQLSRKIGTGRMGRPKK